MAHLIEGHFVAGDHRIAIVASRFNEFITRRLLDAALDCLHRHGFPDDRIDVIWCPGAFELPQVAELAGGAGKYSAIIVLGCIIRGATPHFEYIASAAASGVERAARTTGVPMVFGVLTTNSLEQAIERAGSKSGNKGWDAALSAIEMADLFKKLKKKK